MIFWFFTMILADLEGAHKHPPMARYVFEWERLVGLRGSVILSLFKGLNNTKIYFLVLGGLLDSESCPSVVNNCYWFPSSGSSF